MNRQIVIHSLEELGQFADLISPEDEPTPPITEQVEMTTDLAALAAAASRAAAQLQELVERDAVARREAELALTQHHRLQEEIAQLERITGETESVRSKAEELSNKGFDPACRNTAVEVGTVVKAVASTAEVTLTRLRGEAAILAQREDVARLISEEQERADAIRREEEARPQAEKLRGRVAEAEALLREGNENEAEELLGQLLTEQPNEPELASRIDNLRRRIWGVKTVRVEDALREARRLHRREPRQALDRLEAVDLTGMPEELVRQVYGCWLDACRRLKLDNAVHYSPAFGKGAVLTPDSNDRLEVVSAIGLQRWQAGAHFSSSGLRGVRPLI
ncbi:MAG: hypothetical protein GEU75_17045 [Dehalococcoidia bacterium]|nr:hypothetical protein [Dehalococcoidia bacterium]